MPPVPHHPQAPPAAPPTHGAIEIHYDLGMTLPLSSMPPTRVNGHLLPASRDQVQWATVPAGTVTVECLDIGLGQRPSVTFILPPGRCVRVYYASSLIDGARGSLSLTAKPPRTTLIMKIVLGAFAVFGLIGLVFAAFLLAIQNAAG